MEISNLPDKEFKVIVIKMLTNFRRRMDEHSKKEKHSKMYQMEVITTVKKKKKKNTRGVQEQNG